MNANELRIGNWVIGNKPFQVKGSDISLYESREKAKLKGILQGSQLPEPIPLTEEWLEKFGFNKTELANGNKFNVLINQSSGFSTYLIIYNKGSVSNPVFVFVLKTYNSNHVMTLPNIESYVHSLQNLYFALTGEELEYERD